MNNYSDEEKLQIIKLHYSGHSLRQIRDYISAIWQHHHIPGTSTIQRFIAKFEKTGTLNFKKEINEIISNNEENILALIELEPTMSVREISRELNIHFMTVHKILKKHKYIAFKFQNHQNILERDFELRALFCEIMMEKSNYNREFLSSILFTDECTFTMNGEPNGHNYRYWSQNNPHNMIESRTQYRHSVNVWAGILGDKIIGPFFIQRINSNLYLNLLINFVGPEIAETNKENVWFQHDGCPAHSTREVVEYLNQAFPASWIGRRGPVNWPARSPDLNPCDFFLWGHLKTNVYQKRYQNVEELKNAITQEFQKINNRQLKNVRQSFYNRLGYCLAQNGGLFEHLL